MALTIAGLMLSSVAYASQQADLLSTWVNDKKLSLKDIVQKAEAFDNKTNNPHEGITCISKDALGYNILVHPNPAKNKNAAAFTDEENKVLAQVFAAVNGKQRTEAVPVSYTVNQLNKEGTAYLVEKDSFCMAYQVVAKK